MIQLDNTGEYFYALGQDALWHIQHAELIEEINVFKIVGQYEISKIERGLINFALYA